MDSDHDGCVPRRVRAVATVTLVEVLVGALLAYALAVALHSLWILIFRPDEW